MTASKFTAERRQKALDMKALGASDETAAAVIGVDKGTFSKWLEKGRTQEVGPYAQFWEDYQAASVQMNGRALAVVANNITEPGLAKWYLERKEPGFAPPDRQAAAAPAPISIRLAFSGAQPRPGTVIDVAEVPAEPSKLPERTTGPTGNSRAS